MYYHGGCTSIYRPLYYPLDPWLQNLSKLIKIRTIILHINLIRLQIENTKRKRPREQGLGNDEG